MKKLVISSMFVWKLFKIIQNSLIHLLTNLFIWFRLRYWDGIIFIPNVIFLIFLLIHFKQAQLKLRQTTSPIFATFYLLVFINIISSIIRCVISMMVNASTVSGDITDKVCVTFKCQTWFVRNLIIFFCFRYFGLL